MNTYPPNELPKNIVEMKAAITKTLICSANSIMAKFLPVSSVVQPPTISVSALGVENGLSSRTPKYEITITMNNTINIIM